jgi:hypothetical protein
MRRLRGSNADAVIATLNPIIRGWAAYYRGVVSSKVFHALDYQIWKLTYKWATWCHNNKPSSYSAGLSVGGSHAPVVKSWRRVSSLSSPHLVAVSR